MIGIQVKHVMYDGTGNNTDSKSDKIRIHK